jgi:hypothetical protein
MRELRSGYYDYYCSFNTDDDDTVKQLKRDFGRSRSTSLTDVIGENHCKKHE